MTLFGSYAVESMRLEKGYRHWKADLNTEFDPFASALDRFVSLDKPYFVGKDALLQRRNIGAQRRFVSLEVDCTHAPAQAGGSILGAEGTCIGTVTSGGWGYRTARNIAMGFVDAAHASIGAELKIEIIGEAYPAKVVEPDLYDPANERVRA